MTSGPGAPSAEFDQLIREAEQLHSAPGVAQSLLTLTRDPEFDIREVVECLERDPALSLKLLRVLNSARYGLSQPVRNLRQAVLLLGQRTLRLMTLSFSVLEVFSRGPARSVYTQYWRQAVTMANTALKLSEDVQDQNGHDAYTAGLLSHVGILLFAQRRSEIYLPLFEEARSGAELIEAEQDAFGFDHAQLGGSLLERWGLPEELVAAVRDHHQESADALAEIVHAGDLLGDVLWKPGTTSVESARQWLREHHGLDMDDFITLAQKTSEAIALEAEIYGIWLGNVDCQNLLESARRQYLELSLETAMDLDSLTSVLQDGNAFP